MGARTSLGDMPDEFARLREEYTSTGLAEADLTPEPAALFRRWFEEARAVREPNTTSRWKVRASPRRARRSPSPTARTHAHR